MEKIRRMFRSKKRTAAPPTLDPAAGPPPPQDDQAEAEPYGLRVLAKGTNPTVDIVAVHGLNGHRERTWTAANGTHWLRDLLPQDAPNARILA